MATAIKKPEAVTAEAVAATLRSETVEIWCVWPGGTNNVLGFFKKPTATHSMVCKCGCGQTTEFVFNPQNYNVIFPVSIAHALKLQPHVPAKTTMYMNAED